MKKNKKITTSTFDLLKSLFVHLSKKRKIQITLLLILMLLSSLAELLSLASLIPFLTLISNPEKAFEIKIIENFAYFFNLNDSNTLLLFFSIVFGLCSILAVIIRLTNISLNHKLVAAIGSDLSLKAYKLTLYQPYKIHIKRNSSRVVSALSTQIDFTQFLIGFTLQFITNLFISIGILIGIYLANWKIAFLAGLFIGGTYLFIINRTKPILIKNSKFISGSMNTQVKNLQEGLGSIRDIILDGSQKTFIDIYAKNDIPRRSRQANNQYFQQFPKLILESVTLIFVSIICILLVSNDSSNGQIVTILGTLALGAQKLLPACQQIYSAWVGIKANSSSAIEVLHLLNQKQSIGESINSFEDFKFEKDIKLQNIKYGYNKKDLIFDGIDLVIKKGEILGIVGSTGSGKSTLIDLIMGLLKPNEGIIKIDDFDLHKKNKISFIQAWRKSISHIPQHIFLKDASVAENIAFGIDKDSIDKIRLMRVAEIANIKSFIENKLGGYHKFVGEKGVKLSGGQLQRIGIARALYKKSEILVMDEATSSLDTLTEKNIINALIKLPHKPTIIMIAHRLSTLSNCDRLIQIENGRIVKEGKPEEIIPFFKNQLTSISKDKK